MSKKKAKSSQIKGNDKKKQTSKKVISKKSAPKSAKKAVKVKPKAAAKSKPSSVKKNKVVAKKPIAKKPVKKIVAKAKPAKKIVAKAKKVVKAKSVKKVIAKAKKVVKAKPVKKAVAKKAKPVVKKKTIVTKSKPVAKAITKKVVAKVKAVVAKPAPKKAVPAKPTPVVKAKPVAEKAPVAKVVIVKAPEPKPGEKVEPKLTAKQKKALAAGPKIIIEPLQINQVPKNINNSDKQTPEPKGKYELEYVIHSSTSILFEFLTSPSGLSEWFCDDVNIRNDIYTFFWDGSQQQAKLIKLIEEKLVRYQLLEKADGTFFEFKIERDELTNDISLIVSDFADNEDEKTSSKLLWDSQIDKLMHVLGSYF